MDTTVTSTERVVKKGARTGGGPGGRGWPPPRNGPGGDGRRGHDRPRDEFSTERYRIGMWVGLAAVAMMFTALTSAYIVRAASSDDWRPLTMPRVLWLSTGMLVASSVTFEFARGALKRRSGAYGTWLLVTASLGLGFLASQLMAWRSLVRQGVYLASNPHSSFFYLLTGAHGLHLLGGVLALGVVLTQALRKRESDRRGEEKRRAVTDAVGLYWHFMDGLWLYLFVLLFLWR
ncbi:MAG TPA: cytochrome c oxidase subunit 3 [Pyrinomonadaceae bacterium]|jgi:cytochrome c oxidase subunit 3